MKLLISLLLSFCSPVVLAHHQNEPPQEVSSDLLRFIESDGALDSLNQAAEKFLTESDSTNYFRAKIAMVERFVEINKPAEAITYSNSIVTTVVEYLSASELTKHYTTVSTALLKARDLDGAKTYVEQAITLVSERKDKELVKLKAKLLAELGYIYWSQRRFVYSEKVFEQSLELYFGLSLEETAYSIYQVSKDYAVHLRLRGKKKKSFEVLSRSEKVVLNYIDDNDQLLVNIYTEMGSAYNFTFAVEKSTSYYMKAKAILDRLPDNRTKVGNYYILAFKLSGVKDFENAAIYAKRGIEMAKKIIGPKSAWVVSGMYTLSIAYLESGKKDLAEKVATEALAICKESGLTSTQTGIQMLNMMGKIKEHKHEYEQALEYLLRAEEYLSKRSMQALENLYSTIGNTLGSNLMKLNKVELALSKYHKSLILNSNSIDSLDVLLTPQKSTYKSIDWAFSSLKGKSLALERIYDQTSDSKYLFAALSALQAADVVITEIKQISTSINDLLGSRPEVVTVLRAGVRVCHKLYLETQEQQYLERAFHYSEAAKSNLILSSLQESLVLNKTNMPEGVLIANDNALKDITYYEQELFKAKEVGDAASINSLTSKLPGMRLKADSIKRVINDIDPNFFEVKFSNEFEKIEDIRKDLNEQEIVLNYSIGDSSLFIFEISKVHVAMHKKVLDSNFPKLVNQFTSKIKEPTFDAQPASNYLKLSKAIKDYLIPQSVQLEGVKKITIIPDDYISLIPFEAIAISAKGSVTDHSSLDYLINRYTITYANSATIWARQELSINDFKTTEVLAFAPIFDQNGIDAVVKKDSSRAILNPLNWTSHEVNEISKHFKTRQLLAQEANERNFRKSAGAYPIIHIASHGLLNQKNTRFSKLVFSPFETDSINDGFLNTQELYALKIPAEMVVLSACNTAVGDIISGEGIISLANGFFYAGTKSAVMSLWIANDQSTATIVGEFYAQLAEGKTKSVALRNAKLDYLNKADGIRSHPYYWAHMVVNGSDHPLRSQSDQAIYLFLMVMLGAGLSMLALRRKGQKK